MSESPVSYTRTEEAPDVRSKFDLRMARASRRELHHKSQAAARDARAVLAKAREYKNSPGAKFAEGAAAYNNYVHLSLEQKRLGSCHRIWTAIAAFLAGRPLQAVEPRSPWPRSKRRPYGAAVLAETILEVAADAELRRDRKSLPEPLKIGQSVLYLEVEKALRAWLDAK